MKIAVSGKGGVGKTTIAAALAGAYAAAGRKVYAVDADPDANLAQALGLSQEESAKLRPIALEKELILERTSSQNLTSAGGRIFTLNPEVADIPERFSTKVGNINLLLLGQVKGGGAGCYCPENVLLKRLLNHLFIHLEEAVIVDMEAGLEHLNRGSSSAVDAFVVVVEPGARSIKTARQIASLAADLRIERVYAVANKIRGPKDEQLVRAGLGDIPLLGTIAYNEAIIEADINEAYVFEAVPALQKSVLSIKTALDKLLAERTD